MIFIRFTFLLLFLTSVNIYAQTQPPTVQLSSNPQAYKFDEYGKITTKKLKIRLTNFVIKLGESRSHGNRVTGYIVVHAPNEKKMNQRGEAVMKFLRASGAGFIDFDLSIISAFIPVRDENEKTEFWIVPEVAEPPKIESEAYNEAYKFDEFDKITIKRLKPRLRDFVRRVVVSNYEKKTNTAGYIVVYAPNLKKTNSRVDTIIKAGFRQLFDLPLDMITFIDVKDEREKTEFWIVPEGAKPPTFKKQEK